MNYNTTIKIPNIDYNNHPAYGQLFDKPKLSQTIEAVKILFPALKQAFLNQVRSPKPLRPLANLNPTQNSPLLKQLVQEGAVSIPLNSEEIGTVKLMAETCIKNLNRKTNRTNKLAYPIPSNKAPELYTILNNILQKDHVLKLASDYCGREIKLQSIVYIVNWQNDNFKCNLFQDCRVKDPITNYMHIDSTPKYSLMKAILYLEPVSELNGPFCYIPGSNNMKGYLENIIRKAFYFKGYDYSLMETVPEMRQLFYALPKFLRKKAEFGNDFFEITSEVVNLISQEHKFTSEDGDVILFDPDGIHRGGLVKEGQRKVLQIILA